MYAHYPCRALYLTQHQTHGVQSTDNSGSLCMLLGKSPAWALWAGYVRGLPFLARAKQTTGHSCVYVPLCRSLIIKASKSNWITCASPKTKTNSTVLLNLVQKILHVHQQYTLYYITYNTKYTVCTSTVYIIV